MTNQGGRYVIRDGKRELVHRTKAAPDPKPQAPAKAAAKPAVQSAKSSNVKEKGNAD